ncbi:MAG: C10 family peptidase [Paludibacteraceae bacterium]|nr:C10 family peptidase [Paludibacteraceae bacterium]
MKRLYIVIQLLIGCFFNLIAQNISPSGAEDIAIKIFQKQSLGTEIKNVKPLNTSNISTIDDNFNPYLYVVETIDDNWAVVAGDSIIPPILAMGSGGFPAINDMPIAMKYLFESYIDEIKYLIDSLKITQIHPEWDLLQISDVATIDDYDKGDCLLEDEIRGENFWKQSENNETDDKNIYYFDINKTYNKYCFHPDYSTKPPTGCGAIAMGQIMWYWQWPNIGIIPDTIFRNGENNGIYDLHFYNWDLMPNAIYDETPQQQADMIAYFLRDCGYAAKMKYFYNGDYESTTQLESIKEALIKSFNYKIVDIKNKDNTKNWGKLLRQELKDGRPIIYSGTNGSNLDANLGYDGHVFVVDGYKGIFNNLFHINWGWGDFYDADRKNGFYYLNKLSPKEEDQLLFEEIQNFNYNQSAIFGLEPDIMCGHASIYRPNTLSNALGHISVTGTFSIVSNITNNSDIVINAGAEIELRPGFYVGKGCDVYLNTLFLDCNNTYSSISYAPQYENNKRNEIIIEDNIDIIAKENNLIIDGHNREIYSISLYNLHGQIISSANEINMNVSQIPSGVYIVKILFTDGYSITKKIVL